MPKEAKMSFEEKLTLVQSCIRKEIGVCEASRKAQVARSTVREWIKQNSMKPRARRVCFRTKGIGYIQQRSRQKRY